MTDIERLVRETLDDPVPPPGWTGAGAVADRRRLMRSTELIHHVGKSAYGPRADAESTADLPTLTPGRDRLPTACQHCSSRFLNTEQPLGQHQRGLITCGRCSRQLCWLAPGITTRSVAPSNPAIEAAREGAEPQQTPRRVVSGRFNRGVGCGVACSTGYGHDPKTHEAWGRRMALAELQARPTGTVRTGSLVIDFDADLVTVDGADPGLTPNEHAILLYLAARLGGVCRHSEIVESVWGAEMAALWVIPARSHGKWHVLRVQVSRLRGKLGSSRSLLESIEGRGYILRTVPPIGEVS